AGSFNVSALATGRTPTELLNIWLNNAANIFHESYWKRTTTMDNTLSAAFDAAPIRDMAISIVGQTTLGQVKKKILIPAFNLDPSSTRKEEQKATKSDTISGLKPPITTATGDLTQQLLRMRIPRACGGWSDDPRWFPEYFHNFDSSDNADTLLADACLRSAAAPTYFPIYQGYVDGGVFANNPSLAAITSCICEGVQLSDICVLSLSTGNNPHHIPKEMFGDGNWGVYQWGMNLINLLMDSTSCAATHQSACLLGEQFYRIDPRLTSDIDLADSSAATIDMLLKIASEVDLEPVVEWLKIYWGSGGETSAPKERLEYDWMLL
ncbi:hypothetical protein PROFUN_15786, partial [Planoprotostelium fungivorum]